MNTQLPPKAPPEQNMNWTRGPTKPTLNGVTVGLGVYDNEDVVILSHIFDGQNEHIVFTDVRALSVLITGLQQCLVQFEKLKNDRME